MRLSHGCNSSDEKENDLCAYRFSVVIFSNRMAPREAAAPSGCNQFSLPWASQPSPRYAAKQNLVFFESHNHTIPKPNVMLPSAAVAIRRANEVVEWGAHISRAGERKASQHGKRRRRGRPERNSSIAVHNGVPRCIEGEGERKRFRAAALGNRLAHPARCPRGCGAGWQGQPA